MLNTAVETNVIVDYPQEGERVSPGRYTLRIAADGADRVIVSIDEGQWQPARKAAGYWWYDWETSGMGPHQVEARAFRSGERPVTSEPRRFSVEA